MLYLLLIVDQFVKQKSQNTVFFFFIEPNISRANNLKLAKQLESALVMKGYNNFFVIDYEIENLYDLVFSSTDLLHHLQAFYDEDLLKNKFKMYINAGLVLEN